MRIKLAWKMAWEAWKHAPLVVKAIDVAIALVAVYAVYRIVA